MEKDLFKTLNELKNISPEAGYSVKSRNLLLAEIKNKPAAKKFSLADVLATAYPRGPIYMALSGIFVILAVTGSVFYAKNEMTRHSLVVEADEVNSLIQVKLNEITYLLNNKAIDYQNGLEIQTMLDKAVDELKQASEEKDNEKSLEKIKEVQQILVQIDTTLKK